MLFVTFHSAAQDKAILLETLPIKVYTGGVMLIDAKLGNSDRVLHFILDTGSGGISLDSATCAELEVPQRPTDTVVNGIGGGKKVSYAFNQTLKTGNLKTPNLDFFINDYTLLTSVYGEKIDGIIGYTFFKRYIVEIDYDSSKVKLYSNGKYRYPSGGHFLNTTFNKLIVQPAMVVDKEKSTSNFYLDTGAGLCLLLTESFIKDNKFLLRRRRPVTTQVQGLGGKKLMRITVIKRLRIGPYNFINVPTNLFDDEVNLLNYPYVNGLLGNDIMRRFNTVLNYAEKQIYIKPNSHFNDQFDYAYTGMSLYNINDIVYIDDVIENSPASKAGLKNGDEVLAVSNRINGTVQEYENILQKAKDRIRIIVRRGASPIILTITPERIR